MLIMKETLSMDRKTLPKSLQLSRYFYIADVGQPKNVLTPEALQLMLKVHALINQINPQNVTFDNICYR